ncbi:DUF4382 domain-containing protein [Zeaxanthinibacter enoshimensis]|uniref:Uncharacterized protein DUF4382 n=1 Tax=Zeaxanthinibacter enoshimensis TaxID=392009 RepID=A0A4R6TND6_9FLAO|nr:DUF4382 domain-containing protein [Zeaxanthinibacter enoshimensis]TDQ33082.1 uncharacterized protein DUF4382 [Zeaxanthinibacter enoshimensis]
MKHYLKPTALVLALTFFAVSCSKDENDGGDAGAQSYNTTYKITDAPIDNANVEAVFVTITDVKVDGQSLEGFTATTVDLKALVDGRTETLGNLDMKAGTYSDIKLVLDFEKDVNGNAPGCYVEMADGTKDELTAASNTITVNDAYEVFAGAENEVVLDFDLRKTIKEEQGTMSSDFEFVSMSEISGGIRTVNAEITGKINGTVNDSQNTSDKIIVYAYEKGTFDAEAETRGSGESQVTFSNAVTSSTVSGLTNSYSLNFLEEGEYELVFVSYTENEGSFDFNALLEAESSTGLNLGGISVTGALQVSANVTITGTR